MDTSEKPIVLFLCTGNSCRSQMAEGWARHLKGHELIAFSAGIEKHGLNPYARKVMAEAGVDISGQNSKLIDDLPVREFDYVVTVCDHAHEQCPFLATKKKMIHKSFPDPPKLAAKARSEGEILDCYRLVRDKIRDFVAGMPENLNE